MIDTESQHTEFYRGIRATVYSTDEAVRVEFNNGDICAGAWLTEELARELIVILASVVNAKAKPKEEVAA